MQAFRIFFVNFAANCYTRHGLSAGRQVRLYMIYIYTKKEILWIYFNKL